MPSSFKGTSQKCHTSPLFISHKPGHLDIHTLLRGKLASIPFSCGRGGEVGIGECIVVSAI